MLSARLHSGAAIGLSIDDAGRIILATAPADLEQSGIVVGTVVAAIDEQPAHAFLAAAFQKGEEILSCRPRVWSFIVGEQTVRVALALIESQAPPGEVIRVRLTCEGYADGGVAIDINTGARTVVLGEVPANLAQIDVAVGAVCVAIDDQPPFEVLESDVGVPAGVALPWDFTAGVRSARLMLIFRNETGADEPAEAPMSEGAIPHNTEPVANPGYISGIPMSDRSYHDRPPRQPAVHWDPFREPDDPGWWDCRPAPRPVPKPKSPLYDR
jgi:hypothetical protein